jgi:hypothetical protein
MVGPKYDMLSHSDGRNGRSVASGVVFPDKWLRLQTVCETHIRIIEGSPAATWSLR